MSNIVAYHPTVRVQGPDGSIQVRGSISDWDSDVGFLKRISAALREQGMAVVTAYDVARILPEAMQSAAVKLCLERHGIHEVSAGPVPLSQQSGTTSNTISADVLV